MKNKLDDIYADIDTQYGKTQFDANVRYILRLFEEHLNEDGTLDDKIPVPTVEAAMKAVILIVDRPELPWETICKEIRIKRVMEYLFIRAANHHEEVHQFVKRLLAENASSRTQRLMSAFINLWDFMCQYERPSRFASEIIYPEKSELILSTLHQLLQDEVGKGAALVLRCTKDEGLIRDIRHSVVCTEFPHVQKTAYNNYMYFKFTEKEEERIKHALRTKIGYMKNPDGTLTFIEVPSAEKNLFYQVFRMIGFAT